MAESYPNRYKTLWEKEKLLVTGNFSFSQCFQKACFPGASKGVIVWEWVKGWLVIMWHYEFRDCTSRICTYLMLKCSKFHAINLKSNRYHILVGLIFYHTILNFNYSENTLWEKDNNYAGYQHFLLLPLCYQKMSLLWVLKAGIVWYRVNVNIDKILYFS